LLPHDEKSEAGNAVVLKAMSPAAARLFEEHLRAMEQRARTAQKVWVPAKWLVLLALLSLASTIFYILNYLEAALWAL
jgi:hypothetical protein